MSSARLLINGNLYDLSISGAGAAILLLHGFSGDKSTWQALRGDLEAEYTVIAIDILGHGASAKPSQVAAYRMENVAADIVGLLDELALGPIAFARLFTGWAAGTISGALFRRSIRQLDSGERLTGLGRYRGTGRAPPP